MPTQFSHSHVFCASVPKEHIFVSCLVEIVSNDVAEHVISVSLELFPLMVVRLSASQQVVNAVAVYRSPPLSPSLLHDMVQEYIEPTIARSTATTLVVGNFNVDARQSTVLPNVIQHVMNTRSTSSQP